MYPGMHQGEGMCWGVMSYYRWRCGSNAYLQDDDAEPQKQLDALIDGRRGCRRLEAGLVCPQHRQGRIEEREDHGE